MNKKIFLGLSNIASQFVDLKEGFKDQGYETMSVINYSGSVIVNNKVDLDLTKLKAKVPSFQNKFLQKIKYRWDIGVNNYAFRKAIKECDIFIFFWNSFRPDYSDLKELKQLNKKVISVFVGDDARWYYGMKQEFLKYGFLPMEYDSSYDYSVNGLTNRLRRLRNAERYADFVFSRMDQSQIELRPYFRWNMMVDTNSYRENTFQNRNRPVIVHAPSSKEVKGTRYIIEILDKLRKDNIDFEYTLVENMSNLKAREVYEKADIIIDQILCPGTGKLSTEGLAMGKIVFAHMAYDSYPQKNPKDCPIIDVNYYNLYDKLKNVINDYEFRVEHAKKGRDYVKRNLDVRIFCKKVIELCNGKSIDYDYIPTFFRDEFIPESEEATHEYNKWNRFVSDCNWYKQTVKPGERSGLVF